jgi:hypothetical protein
MSQPSELRLGYIRAKTIVASSYYKDIDWAQGLEYVRPNEHYTVLQVAWVIMNSGFKYSVAMKLWPKMLDATGGFDPLVMVRARDQVRLDMLKVLNYPKKVDAILEVARIIQHGGLQEILEDAKDPPKLTRLPFIGKVTCWHLAKILGIDCVKPDVHLKRAATAAGFSTPLELCQAIQGVAKSESLTLIDTVLWRYGEQMKARGWPDWPELWSASTPWESRLNASS